MKFSRDGFEFDGIEFPWGRSKDFVQSLGLGDAMRALAELETSSRASDAHTALLGALQWHESRQDSTVEEPAKDEAKPSVKRKRGRPRG